MKITIFSMCLVAQFSASFSKQCVTFKNTTGICKPDRECKYFREVLDRKNHKERIQMMETKCGNGINELLLCCPMSKSEKNCQGFGQRPSLAPSTTPIPAVFLGVRIIAGIECEPNEFPQFAALGYKAEAGDKIAFSCGGTLISKWFVLTAAHCVKSGLFMVRLGKRKLYYDKTDEIDGTFDRNIAEAIKHRNHSSSQKYNDIALLRLAKEVDFSFEIWPACLPQQNEFVEIPLTIVGFGRTNVTSALQSEVLMTSNVEEIPLNECRHNYYKAYGRSLSQIKLRHGITGNLLCAKNRKFHTDTCQGDSGSGLFHVDVTNDKLIVVGVVSFGISCNTSLPSFYTRVASYREWIEDIVWPSL